MLRHRLADGCPMRPVHLQPGALAHLLSLLAITGVVQAVRAARRRQVRPPTGAIC